MLRTCRLSSKFGSSFKISLSRAYASVAALPVTVTKSKAGITVVSVEDSAPASSVSLVVKAGSREEGTDNVGVAHYLKNFAFKNTSARTAFRTTREAELLGGFLSANLARENLILSAEFLRGDLGYFMEILSDIVFKTKYEQHEFPNIKESVNFERGAAAAIPEVTVMNAAHSVAFRHGLGNSLFADDATKVSNSSDVKAFANKVYTAPNIMIVGTSVNHGELLNLTDSLFQNISHAIPSTPIASKYFGGECRISIPGDSHFVLAFSGAPAGTSDYAALQILRFLIDGEKGTKWGEGVNVLAQRASKLDDTKISFFNAGYSDAGLFGVHISGIATSVYSAARSAVEQLKHAANKISKDDFARALAKARFNAAAAYETRASKTEIFGNQILFSGKVTTVTEALTQFDRFKVEDIQSCKPTAVALGDVSALPYSDSLSL
ncbi:14937_t:CDS:2 [Cetraspora pellucida]|uniref:Cytochrome b-c1 complex subunit 2, mitochondrial n=1 Tax=Cetraspora pellucida TaxID=1433469 RepID=A0A9N9II39_9GLOM|nr:14937_t:CDS:2 [Cetraspora pellucida]